MPTVWSDNGYAQEMDVTVQQGKKIANNEGSEREGGEEEENRGTKQRKSAPAGNRTRVCTVAGYYSTTRPLVLYEINQTNL